MIDFKKKCIKHTCAVEAGYVLNEDDLGRATNHGVTESKALEFKRDWHLFDWDGCMETMPIEFAYHVYDKSFWEKMWLDRVALLSETLAATVMDFGVNAGTVNAIEALQRILNVHNRKGETWDNIVADGYMGPGTYKALQAYFDNNTDEGDLKLTGLMLSMQDAHYVGISENRSGERNETFTNGWTNRTWEAKKDFWADYYQL